MINGQYVAYAKYDPPIWQDTIALPVQGATWDIKAGPIFNQQDAEKKCPGVCSKNQAQWNNQWTTIVEGVQSVCGCTVNNNSDGTAPNGYVKMNHRYLEFTGEYVLHCHFLGHEDPRHDVGRADRLQERPEKLRYAQAVPAGGVHAAVEPAGGTRVHRDQPVPEVGSAPDR